MTRAIVTDIEGTTSSISFVKDVLFPYAYDAMPFYLLDHALDPRVKPILDRVAAESGVNDKDLMAIVDVLRQWIKEDRKDGGLKALQGMIWEDGYYGGEFTAPVYEDALSSLREWNAAGVPLYVYSSGSVPAQKLLFSHTDEGDVTSLFSGWFDTAVGGKRDVSSYQTIASDIDVPADEILFLSDIVEELDAAREAGFQTVLVDRLGDYPTPRIGDDATHGHTRVTSFDEISR